VLHTEFQPQHVRLVAVDRTADVVKYGRFTGATDVADHADVDVLFQLIGDEAADVLPEHCTAQHRLFLEIPFRRQIRLIRFHRLQIRIAVIYDRVGAIQRVVDASRRQLVE
jgi:hypothetical protein